MTRIAVAGLILLAGLASPAAAQKKRVAVLDFDYATVHSRVSAIFGTDQDIGLSTLPAAGNATSKQ